MNARRLLQRLMQGALYNVHFADFTELVEEFGFRKMRTSGSHHVFAHPKIKELVNLQEVDGQAKPYQIRQFLHLVQSYSMKLKEDAPEAEQP